MAHFAVGLKKLGKHRIIDELEKIQRNFLWHGNSDSATVHWIAWEKVKAPKDVGGVGIGSIEHLNFALLAKWWWKYKSSPNSLWASIVGGIHNLNGRSLYCLAIPSLSGVWLRIASIKAELLKLNIPVHDILYSLDNGQTWKSDFIVNGDFIVAKLRDRLVRAHHIICDGDFWWLNMAPKKVVTFVWRAKQGRIPSADALNRRNIPLASISCGLCPNEVETVDHILSTCPLAADTINMVLSWCQIPIRQFVAVTDVICFVRKWVTARKKDCCFLVLYMALCVVFGWEGMEGYLDASLRHRENYWITSKL